MAFRMIFNKPPCAVESREHSRHRSFDNFIVNMLGAIAAYCMFPKKPYINLQRTVDTQLTLF